MAKKVEKINVEKVAETIPTETVTPTVVKTATRVAPNELSVSERVPVYQNDMLRVPKAYKYTGTAEKEDSPVLETEPQAEILGNNNKPFNYEGKTFEY